MQQQRENDNTDITSICNELRLLYDRIPMFATWKIDELEAVAWRYVEILCDLIRIPPYEELCGTQVRSLPGIMSKIREAAASRHWSHFNQAAVALGWDIEALLTLLCMHGPGERPN